MIRGVLSSKVRPMSDDQVPYAVILAGGSGTRFWPASRRLRPKQLLPLGPSAPLSLIASTLDRLAGFVPEQNVLVATGQHLVDATRRELPSLSEGAFLAEPSAKNTAPCIAWAAHVIARKDPDAVVCVLPSDQHAQNPDEFQNVLRRAVQVASEGVITTIGIVPTRPETGYGYVRRGAVRSEGSYRVQGFFEKPDSKTAEGYVAAGEYYWNAGIFVFRARDMVAAIERHLPAMTPHLRKIDEMSRVGASQEQAAVAEFFGACESVSIDYGVMEKEAELAVVPGNFGWSDLGSWESSWELSPKDDEGNASPPHAILVDARDNLVEDLRTKSSAADKVIALIGVEGLCVVETDDALLIMPKSRSQDVREVVSALKERNKGDLI